MMISPGRSSCESGCALRAVAELLPADGPIVRALRLPERLTEISSRYYSIVWAI